MKKQIDGKRYSTAAARKIGYGDDKNAQLGCLYVKRNGEAFIAQKEDKIKPLTETEALEWAKDNRLIAQYVAALDYAIADKKQLTVYITEFAISSLKKLCTLWGTSQSEAVEKLLQDGFERAAEKEQMKEQLLKELELNYGYKPPKM